MGIALFGADIDREDFKKVILLLEEIVQADVELFCFKGLASTLEKISKEQNYQLPPFSEFESGDDLPEDIDLFLTLGGDGTFLHSLTVVKGRNIDIAGINFGRLGFLTAAKVVEGDNEWIKSILSGQYDVIERTLLKVDAGNLSENFYPYALNEVSIQRRSPYMIGIDVRIDGYSIPTYWADGMLIATPTGSTAYSMSVGGPIVTPNSNVFIISPIAPHNLNVRPLIVPQDSEIEIKIHSRGDEVMLTIDNREVVIPSDKVIRLGKGDFKMKTVSLRKESFFDALREKLLWGEDRRNYLTYGK